MNELPIIQKTYDLIKLYVPILNRTPRDHKYILGSRVITALYDLLDGLVQARYAQHKLDRLRQLNSKIDVIRYQTRLLYDFELLSVKRYEYASLQLRSIGIDLGSWIKQQNERKGV